MTRSEILKISDAIDPVIDAAAGAIDRELAIHATLDHMLPGLSLWWSPRDHAWIDRIFALAETRLRPQIAMYEHN